MFDSKLSDEALLRGRVLWNIPSKPGKPGELGLIGVSRATFHRLRETPGFPKPVRPVPGVVAWRAGDIKAWLQSKADK
jgi:predicted DNA-binding transcriptional regulator AlpA